MICSYFIRFLVEGVGRNWYQSSVLYLASSPTCGRGLLVNSQKSIFYIGNPSRGFQNFSNLPLFRLTACLPAYQADVRPTSTRSMSPDFHTTKVIMSNLRKCCSDEDLSTAPWSFLSSFAILLFFLYLLNDVRKSLKVLIESLRIQLITSQKQPLAPRDIINNAPAVNRRCVFGVYFITSLTSEYLLRQIDFDVFQMYFAIIQLLYHVNASACKT